MPACFIPGCKSGFSNQKDAPKRYFFRPPTDPEMFLKWAEAIPRKDRRLSLKNSICDLHFKDEFFIKTDRLIINNQEVDLPKTEWKLRPGAVPHLFSIPPAYLLKDVKTRKRLAVEGKTPLTTTKRKYNKRRPISTENYAPEVTDNVIREQISDDDQSLPESQISSLAGNVTAISNERFNQIDLQRKLKAEMQQDQVVLQKKLKAVYQKCRILDVRNRKLEEQIKELAIVSKSKVDVKRLPPKFQTVIKMMVRKQKSKSAKGMRYDPGYILESMLLYMKSPVGYRHCASHGLLPLPKARTLQLLYRRFKFDCRVNENAVDAMKNMFEENMNKDRSGILIFDEIKLRMNSNVSAENVHFDGCVDVGEMTKEASKQKLAEHALVFIFVPLLFDWVQPVAVYASCGATPGDVQAKILLQVLQQLENAGAMIVGFTCDTSSESEKVWEHLGISGAIKNTCNSIPHPFDSSRRLYAFTNPPQIIKGIRNDLQTLQIGQYMDMMVDFCYYSRLYMTELEVGEGNRQVPKLTESHINPKNLQKMNVKRAINLFSRAVANGLNFYRKAKYEGFEESEGTETFTRDMRFLFDVTNSKLPACGLRKNSDAHKFLLRLNKLLADDANNFASRRTMESLRVTIRSILDLAEFVWGLGYEYLLTAKLNLAFMKYLYL